MNLDPDNPNLDGDYKALLQVRQQRQVKTKTIGDRPTTNKLEKHAEEVDESKQYDTNDKRTRRQSVSSAVTVLHEQLLTAAETDDVERIEQLLGSISDRGLSLSSTELCSPETGATALHVAVENDAMKVVKYLIKQCPPDFLMMDYGVTVRGTPSRKNVLHQLCEKNDTLDLIRTMLDRIKPGNTKEAFLRKTVLTEITGQRPRHLASIHIAAIAGRTELIKYLVKLGIDVNLLNNKDDTPILWAARWNHLDTAQSLIDLGADLHHQNDKGSSPLYWAVRYGFKEMVQLLISKGNADVNQQRKLGLVAPVVLAAALGYFEIVELLLLKGADVNIKIGPGYTALHYAAEEGNLKTVSILLGYGANIEAETTFGDSPILVASQAKQIEVVELLASHGANIDIRNRSGKTIWDYAMNDPNPEHLTTVVNIYKRVKGQQDDSKITFGSTKTPLHKAALLNDTQMIEVLLNMGVDETCTDEGGNTFFHLAARENCTVVLERFLNVVNVNSQNSDGDTAMHLACRSGHFDAVKILLKKVKLNLTNDAGETALHTASKSRETSAELVNAIVDTIVKAHNWSLVDSQDKLGNTALHLAAKHNRLDLLEVLKPLSPHIKNVNGESAQHIIVRMGQKQTVEAFFKIFEKDMRIEQQNDEGDTMMHIATRQGDLDIIRLLVNSGVDLSVRNAYGNTPLHELVLQTIYDRENTSVHLAVLDTIQQNATKWWCMRTEIHVPDEDSEMYLKIQRTAYLFLTSEILNNEDLSVLSLAARCAAQAVFERILHTPEVYMFHTDKDSVTFDVSRLSSDTMNLQMGSQTFASVAPKPKNHYGKPGGHDNKANENKAKQQMNCLALIVQASNLRDANAMLDVVPLKQLVIDYWAGYKAIYGLLMTIHIVYMGLLSAYGPSLVGYSIDSNITHVPIAFPTGLLLVWPLLITVFGLYQSLFDICSICSGRVQRHPALRVIERAELGPFSYFLRACVNLASYYLNNVIQLALSALIITWYILYLKQDSSMAPVLAVVLILGWLYTIVFTPGFETVHSYSIMIKNIVMRDISRFLMIYLFVLLAFSTAFETLLHLTPLEVQQEHLHFWHIAFNVWNLMIGMHDMFTQSVSNGVDRFGSAGLWLRLIYLLYILLTTIILLNLLIATLTDSYADVKANEGTTWRVGSVSRAQNIDTSIPLLPRFFRFVGIRRYRPQFDADTNRWMMTIPREIALPTGLDARARARDAHMEILLQVQNDLSRLQATSASLEDRLEALSIAVGKALPASEKKFGLHGAVLKMRGMNLQRQKTSIAHAVTKQ